jgi:hypothetical protein
MNIIQLIHLIPLLLRSGPGRAGGRQRWGWLQLQGAVVEKRCLQREKMEKMETWKISGKSFITKRWKHGSIFWGVAVVFLCNFDMTLHFGVFGIIRTY